MKEFDLIVLGGGHAGLEAVYAAHQFNLSCALVTMPGVGIASAPCNPSVGGVGKGQVVKELSVLGGLMPILADRAGIQYRTLNDSKGYAVQSTRVQIDKDRYSEEAERIVPLFPSVTVMKVKAESVTKLDDNFQVSLANGVVITAKKLIVTV